MYCIAELSKRAIVCYANGDRDLYILQENAQSRALAMQAQKENEGMQFAVIDANSPGARRLPRIRVQKNRPLLIQIDSLAFEEESKGEKE